MLLSINEDFNETKIIFAYPNPAENLLFFDNSKIKAKSAILYSVTGKKIAVFTFNNFSSNQNIDVSKLSKGMYFLKVSNANIKVMKE